MVSGWVFLVVELAAMGNFNQLSATAIQMDKQILVLSSLAMLVVGFMIGFIELRYLHHAFSNQRLIIRFLLRLGYYILFYQFLEATPELDLDKLVKAIDFDALFKKINTNYK